MLSITPQSSTPSQTKFIGVLTCACSAVLMFAQAAYRRRPAKAQEWVGHGGRHGRWRGAGVAHGYGIFGIFGIVLDRLSRLSQPTSHAPCDIQWAAPDNTLLRAHAYRMLIVACNRMACPLHVCRWKRGRRRGGGASVAGSKAGVVRVRPVLQGILDSGLIPTTAPAFPGSTPPHICDMFFFLVAVYVALLHAE